MSIYSNSSNFLRTNNYNIILLKLYPVGLALHAVADALFLDGVQRVQVEPRHLVDDGPVGDGLRHPVDGRAAAHVLVGRGQDLGRDLPDVADEPLRDAVLGVHHGDAEVDAGGELQRVEGPAALLHLVGQGVDVERIRA